MPARNTTAEVVARAADRSLRLACARHFPLVQIGEVGKVVSGGTPSTDRSDYWDGDVIWVTPKDLGRPRNIEIDSAERSITAHGLESSSARLLPAGTVLLSSRAPIGHVGIAASPLATNQGFKNIIGSERVCSRFLFHMLRGSIDELVAEGRGNTFLEIPGKIVKAFQIPLPPLPVQKAVASFLDAFYERIAGGDRELPRLPAPLAEHRRMVARIEELAAQVDEARRLRSQAIKQASAVLFSAAGRAFAHAAHQFGEQRLDQLCIQITDGTHATPRYVESGVPFLSVKDITSGKISFEGVRHISPDEHEALTRRCKPERGDVLLTKVGTTGFAKTIDVDREFSIFVSLALLKLDRARLDPAFTEHMLNSPTLRERSAAGTRGVGNKNLVLKFIRAFPIPVPPLIEQRRIVAELDGLRLEVEGLKRLQGGSAAELDALLPAVLDRAFKGDL
jgi:type I restriction enzyme, S subunit